MVRETFSTGHHVVWSRPENRRRGTDLVVVIHGYGANEVRAAQAYFGMLPENVTGLAVRGGFEIDAGVPPVADGIDGVGSGPGGPDPGAWGWFLLDYFLNNDFAEVIAAAHRVFDLLDAEEVTRHEFRSVSVLGHSQGMAMASTVYRLRPEAFACVVGLSGFVLSNPLLEALDNPPEGPGPRPFFWGRDVEDLVIHPDAVAYTADWLETNTRLTARTYEGMGHGTGPEQVRDVRIFLQHTLAAV
ncbi:alpha/beta hydrolase [Citricoccus sp. GCM10030269]|uniref:alpha/beta hydrolase n=1 Tax=Citricoccus sp. GCM10030269 TaxID=3273388 RepID=UPI003614ECB7